MTMLAGSYCRVGVGFAEPTGREEVGSTRSAGKFAAADVLTIRPRANRKDIGKPCSNRHWENQMIRVNSLQMMLAAIATFNDSALCV